jgi:gamma-glutamyltranspeptidase/glutathione hydrolase
MAPGRPLTVGDRGMAATSHPASTLAAVDILRAGGNAVDAAIAAVALQGVIDPHMTGIGGDCFAIYAPANRAARRDQRLGPGSAGQGRAGVVPAVMASPPSPTIRPMPSPCPARSTHGAALSAAHGRKGLDAVLAPAIRAAEDGFVVTPRARIGLGALCSRIERMASAFRLSAGRRGTDDRQQADASRARRDMLRVIARKGRAAFYEGEVAEEIVATLKGLGGLMELDDLAGASCRRGVADRRRLSRPPSLECPPNGQGVAALLIARILAGFDMSDAGLSEADRIHLLAEASKAAYRQRDALVADPTVHPLDMSKPCCRTSSSALRKEIDLDNAPASPKPSTCPCTSDTIYVCVVDATATWSPSSTRCSPPSAAASMRRRPA